jgi:hypothetical protein
MNGEKTNKNTVVSLDEKTVVRHFNLIDMDIQNEVALPDFICVHLIDKS